MKKFTEADLARITCDWLESQGWETFKEVPCYGGRADIVAVRSKVVWIVETKLTLSLPLMTQCRDRLREPCHGVIGAVGQGIESRPILAEWAEANGIGLIAVGSTPRLMLAPRLRRNVNPSNLLKRLHPEQRDQSAGISGKYWTPFKTLVERLKVELREGPLKDAAKLSCLQDYRKRTDAATRRALTDYLRRGLIPGWGVETRHSNAQPSLIKGERATLWIVPRPIVD